MAAKPSHIISTQIVRIDGYEVSCPLPERVGNSKGFFESRGSLLVRLTTAGGVVGWGETWGFPGAAAALIRSDFAPALIGKSVTAPRPLHEAMLGKLTVDRRGISHMAISALDMAIWDAASRTQGVPLHAMLGGALRDRVFAYVSGPFMKPGADPYRDFLPDIDGYLKAGFKAVKIRMGTTPANDGKLIRRLREHIGPDIFLMADLNQGFSANAAIEVAQHLAAHDARWLEEPIVYDDLPGYRRLSQRLPLAMAGGESLVGVGGFREFITERIFDVLQPDLALCGGVSEVMKIAAMADAFDIPVVPHVWGTFVNFHASLQFAAVMPEKRGQGVPFPIFEYDTSYNPLRTIGGEFAIDPQGCIAIPDAPGLGFDFDPEKLKPYLVNTWTLQ